MVSRIVRPLLNGCFQVSKQTVHRCLMLTMNATQFLQDGVRPAKRRMPHRFVAGDGDAKVANDLDRNLLDFMVDDVQRFQNRLSSREKEKLGHYLEGFQARQAKLAAMGETLKNAAPELRDAFTSEIEIERVKADFDLIASSLIAGLTRVCTIRCEHLDMRLTGLGLGAKTVHGIGHMIEGEKGGADGAKFEDGKGEFATRAVILKFHMEQVANLARKLAAVPEGDGTMLDNTVTFPITATAIIHRLGTFP